MQIGMVGLGRMGANMTRRLIRAGHEVVVFDVSADAVAALVADGAAGADSLTDLCAKLSPPRPVWLMVPAPFVDDTIAGLMAGLSAGDIVIDGGNSYYRDDLARGDRLRPSGINYVDVGTSGGVHGLDRGYCLMIGGDDDVVERLDPIFSTLAPGVGDVLRTPGRSGDPSRAEQGFLHCGPGGAGHFVKMVHNGIEYGVMSAYAEGLAILRRANIGKTAQELDAETAPLSDPRFYSYDIDTTEVAEVWRRGSVIGSWLLDLTATALLADPALAGLGGRVSDSGEGRWTSIAAIETGTPAYVLSAALLERFSSRDEGEFANKVMSAMRREFGGHAEKSHTDG